MNNFNAVFPSLFFLYEREKQVAFRFENLTLPYIQEISWLFWTANLNLFREEKESNLL